MRVLLISPFGLHDRGGMGRLICYLTNYWNSRSDGPSYRVIDSRGVGRRIWWPVCFAKAYLIVLGELVRGRIDVAHLHLASKGSTVRKICLVWLIAKFKVPIVLHLHDGTYDRFWNKIPPAFRRKIVRMFSRASQVVVLGQVWKDWVCRELGVPSERVHILMNAVQGPPALHPVRERRRCRIVFLGRVIANKGVGELLEALGSAAVRALAWDAVLVGAGDLARYQTMAREAGIADRVAFPGWSGTERVHQYLEEADLLVLPSYFEGLSMAILEGMAYGLAVITTPVGANAEAIVHGESGLFVPVKDPAALAQALELVLRDDGLRTRLARGARQRYLELFEIGQYAGRLEEMYRQCHLPVCATGQNASGVR
jgi:glycosyltransferase involved in cell wall biosynthesis